MQDCKFLTVNRKVDLLREGDSHHYKTLIQAIEEDNFAVAVPYHQGEMLLLRPGEKVTLKVICEQEQFVFAAEVLDRKKEQIPMYYFAKPQEVTRVQLRDFVRVKVAIEIYYQVISQDDLENLDKLNPSTRALTVDLSGGGLLLATAEVLACGTLVYLNIPIDLGNRSQNVFVVGKVKRFSPANETQLKNLVGIQFENIPERDRDLIINFIFSKLRKQRWLER